jgi:hypothetical protein
MLQSLAPGTIKLTKAPLDLSFAFIKWRVRPKLKLSAFTFFCLGAWVQLLVAQSLVGRVSYYRFKSVSWAEYKSIFWTSLGVPSVSWAEYKEIFGIGRGDPSVSWAKYIRYLESAEGIRVSAELNIQRYLKSAKEIRIITSVSWAKYRHIWNWPRKSECQMS